MATPAQPLTRPVVRLNRWSTFSWVFMRISALALIVLALGHFALQHVFNDVHALSLQVVANRWANVGWRVWDALLLGLGLAHGLNGSRIVVDDYVLQPTANLILKWGLLIIGGGLTIIGMIAIVGGVR